MAVLDYIVGLGASVMMPIIFTIIGTFIGLGFGKSLKAGLCVGVGFVGLSVITKLLIDNLGPVVNAMVNLYGLSTNVLDIGWPAAAAIAYSSTIGALVIPVGVAINILMIITKTTKTMNMDIWNYWHYAFIGSIVYVATGSFLWGMFAAMTNLIWTMCIGELFMPRLHKFYKDLDDVSFTVPVCVPYAPFAIVINRVLDKIPLVNKIDFDAEYLQKRFGVLGEPIFLGTIIGAILGLSAKYAISDVLKLAVTMGAVMVLIPRITALLIEGLKPISEATSVLFRKKFKNYSGILIGMSPSLVIGHPTTLVCTLLAVPLILFISVLLPGNQFLPIASLGSVMYIYTFVTPITKGNVFRTLLIGVLALVMGNYICTNLAPIFTESAVAAGVVLPEGTYAVASFDYAGNPATWITYHLTNLKFVGASVLTAISLLLLALNRRQIKEGKL